MDSDWSVRRLDGHDIALVTVELCNSSPVARQVRVNNRLDGPVLPPRRAGVPESGWDEDGFVGVVPASERRALGYACPAPVDRPPVSVTVDGRADGEDGESAATAARELADPRPPRAAVPTVGDDEAAKAVEELSPVEDWLAAVECRIERGERLTNASVEEATTALETAGCDVADLETRLSTDAAELRAVAERAASLAERASAVNVPVEALRRFA